MTVAEFQSAITGGMEAAGYTRCAKHSDFDYSLSSTKSNMYSVQWSLVSSQNQSSGGPMYVAAATVNVYVNHKSASDSDSAFNTILSDISGMVEGLTAANSTLQSISDSMIGETIQKTSAVITALLEV